MSIVRPPQIPTARCNTPHVPVTRWHAALRHAPALRRTHTRFCNGLLGALAIGLAGGCVHAASNARAPDREVVPTGDQSLEIAAVLASRGESLRAQQYLRLARRQGVAASRVMPRLLGIYVADRQYRLAAEEAEAYLRRHPNDHQVRVLLANIYAALGLPARAVVQFERALAQDPGDPETHFALATTLYDSGRQRLRADRHFRAYLELMPHGPYAEEARSLLLPDIQELP